MGLNRFLAVLVIFPLLVVSEVFAQKPSGLPPKRVAPSEFIIFPWGRMPEDPASGQWGDLADMDAMMRDLYDCGFNTSGFTKAQNFKHVRNNNLVGILLGSFDPTLETTQEKADATIQKLLESIDPEDRKAVSC